MILNLRLVRQSSVHQARPVEYLNHALQDGDETDFRLALADVVRSRKFAVVAKIIFVRIEARGVTAL